MDTSEALSTHYRKFSEFHIDLNKYIKLSVVALNHLSRFSSDPKELSDRIADLIQAAGERWAATNYVDPQHEIEDLKHQLTESALMRVYSSFEVFLDEISGGYDEYKIENPTEIQSNEYGATALKLFSAYGWKTNSIQYLLPIYHFYNIARHCVVHRMGKANSELIAIANSQSFIDAVKNWPPVIPGTQISQPPKINDHKQIELIPHHAIAYSDVCYRLATEINRNLMNMLGYEFILKHVARNRILKCDQIEASSPRDAYKFLRHVLQAEYKIQGVVFSQIKEVLEEAGIRKECFHKYASMRTKAIQQIA